MKNQDNSVLKNLQTIQPFIDNQKAFLQAIRPCIEVNQQLGKELSKIGQSLRKSFQPIMGVSQLFAQVMRPINQQLIENLKKLPEIEKNTIIKLVSEGWFISPEIPLDLLITISYESIEDIETILISYFEQELDNIEKKLSENFSKRYSILKQAFKAHKDEIYELSIPIFLIQADGICLDLTNHHFFYKKSDFNKYVEELNLLDTLYQNFLGPLKNKIPLIEHEKERNQNSNKLNRHTILHGECVNYSSKINSLKTISFLFLLSQVLANKKSNKL